MKKTPKNDAGKKASEPVTECNKLKELVAKYDRLKN